MPSRSLILQTSRKAASQWVCPSCLRTSLIRHVSDLAPTSQDVVSDSNQKGTSHQRHEGTRLSGLTRNKQPRTIFSLIQPTGIPHLGNYLGALRRWKQFQDERTTPDWEKRRNHSLYFGLADLHALSLKQDVNVRQENVRQTYAALLALGLNVKESHTVLFIQSLVQEHAELMWILSNVASTGYLSRMTQWKDKLGLGTTSLGQEEKQTLENLDAKSSEKLKLGLFSYPVLQAADILLYAADDVPVGEDQAQHVEFTRHLARAFNSAYPPSSGKPVFVLPQVMLSPAKRVMSLKNPTKKMSKSDQDTSSRILITDSADEIRQKVKGAKTDSVSGSITYQPEERPGVSNLIEILSHVSDFGTPEEVAAEHADTSLGAFKDLVSENIIKELDGIKDRFESLMQPNNTEVDESILLGTRYARGRAGQTIHRVKAAVGLPSYAKVKRRLHTDGSE